MNPTISTQEAAALMGVTQQYLRAALRRDAYPLWGKAVLMKDGGKRYTYRIQRAPFLKFINGDWLPEDVKGGQK